MNVIIIIIAVTCIVAPLGFAMSGWGQQEWMRRFGKKD